MTHRSLDQIIEDTRRLKESGDPLLFPEHAGKTFTSVDPAELASRLHAHKISLSVVDCKYGGTDKDIIERHPDCKTGARHRRGCDKWKVVTRSPVGTAVMNCEKCKREGLGYEPVPPDSKAGVLRYDEFNLFPGLKGRRFNSSIIRRGNGFVFCWRDGWAGSDLWCCRMDDEFRPVGGAVKLEMPHPEANYGREDPQLFVFKGRLHVAFVGVVGKNGNVHRTSVLYARLGENFAVEDAWAPKAPGVNPGRWEKNWQFFERDGTLYAVYSISPHKILRIDGTRAEWAYETPCPFTWHGGEMRGGTSPVRIGDEHYSFFHDRVRPPAPSKEQYRVGLYTFDSEPPFAIRRYCPTPVLTADPRTNPDNYADVIFPRGAVRRADDWVLSCGAHDRRTELHKLSAAELESKLVSVRRT